MSFSPLVNYVRRSPNHSSRGGKRIVGFAIHCMAGNMSVESAGAWFAKPEIKASCNYGIGSDGRYLGCVDEEYGSWCTSNWRLDQNLITIEVANCAGAPDWPVSPQAYQALINLLIDCCKRNNIRELKWKADKNLLYAWDKQNLVAHRWIANKACPGNYLYDRFGDIAAQVNKALDAYFNPVKPDEEDDDMVTPRFNTLDEIRQAYPWAVATMEKLTDSKSGKAILNGDGKVDANGFYTGLDLTLDMIRILVVNDRAGLYK